MKARITSSVALLLALGLGSSVFAASPGVDAERFLLAANDMVEVTDAVDAVEDEALPEDEVNMEELMAEIRVACQEAADDEQIPEENREAFTEECVAENMAVDSPDDAVAVDDGMVTDEALPVEEYTIGEGDVIPDDAEMVDGEPVEQEQAD